MNNINVLPMLETHCPICRNGPKFDCSDMTRCPLALAKFKGEMLSPEEFARKHGVTYQSPAVEPQQPPAQEKANQFSLF